MHSTEFSVFAIVFALAGNPKLLIMDEPSAGLSPLLVQEVIEILGRQGWVLTQNPTWRQAAIGIEGETH